MKSTAIPLSILFLASVLLIGASAVDQPTTDRDDPQTESNTMQVQYLEIVTKSVNETCEVLSESHDVEFSKPIPELGNARTALLKDGGRIGVRAPMRDTETPVVRPYILVDDIEAAVKAAEQGGAQIAIPPMNIPGQGTFSIYILGGIEHGLWQL
ncbi:MAG: hypothetical protein P1U30_08725 [Phycisphaerales bacterium]|nr:hypothetical protein [Phycisphaerales bacterium]